MAVDRELPEPLGDPQLEQLLQGGLTAPEPCQEFSAALLSRLDREFRRRTRAVETMPVEFTAVDQTALNNSPARGSRSSAEGVLPFSALANPRATTRRRSWRWLGAIGAAAALLVALNLWSANPAYGWAAMIKALQQTTWVQALATQGTVSGWMSGNFGIVAVRSDSQVVFRDERERLLRDYRAAEGVVYQQPLVAGRPWHWQQQFVTLLTSGQSGVVTNLGDSPAEMEVVAQSWRPLDGERDSRPLIELDVTLRIAAERSLRLLFLLDPQTQLPVSCRLLNEAADAVGEFEFVYPSKGPSSIFALGVPREAQVIAGVARARLSGADRVSDAELPRVATRPANDRDGVADPPTSRRPAQVIVADEIQELDSASPPQPEPSGAAPRVASVERAPSRDPPAVEPLAEPLAAEQLVARINAQLSDYWEAQGIRPAEPASDEEFLRRVYLDLTGRIPMVSEVYRFREDKSPARREQLVDELLQRRDHATHLATVWRKMLLPEGVDLSGYGGNHQFDQWLADRFGANVPYSQLVDELLSAEGRVAESGPLLFYAALKLNPEEIAAKTSRAFLGMRMECAQCHDHPFDESISQDDFWGFAAYFAQISRPLGKIEMTSGVLRVRDNARGEVMLPDTEQVIPPRLPPVGIAVPDQAPAEASRRRRLVAWLTSQHNTRFARATVNRVWEHLFGRGLVMPIDDMRAGNDPVCPEVLETLSRDFAASGFDLRKLLRALVLSDAYQLSSWAATDDPAPAMAFARMNIKSFSADQLYDGIAVATQNEAMLAGNATDVTLARIGNQSRQAFIEQFQAPPGQRTDYQAGIPQALALMHGSLVHGATDLAQSGLLKSLQAPFFSDEQRVETLFLATLSRPPSAQEHAQMLAHVRAATDDNARQQAFGDVLWALLNTAEFTFIH